MYNVDKETISKNSYFLHLLSNMVYRYQQIIVFIA